jgi:hypothetical protein
MDQRNVGDLTEQELLGVTNSARKVYVPEQERNFDNKTQPTGDTWYVRGQCEHKGVTYNIVDWR